MRQKYKPQTTRTRCQPLKVLHITASSAMGGGPEHVWQLVQHLPQSIESFIAAPSTEPYGSRFAAAVGQHRMFTLPQRKLSFHALYGLVHFIRHNDIDVIHSHGKGAGVYGRLASLLTATPCVHTFHGIHLPGNPLLRVAYLMFERLLCRISCLSIAVSESEAAKAREMDLCPGRLVAIPNGVEVAPSLLDSERAEPFAIVHVSRFDTVQKNSAWLFELALALRASGILGECRFVMIGDGEERNLLEKKIDDAGLHAFFYFAGEQPSVRPFLKNAGCLISTSRWEGLPLAVLEAQSEGVPAVVTDVIGNRDAVLHEVTGFIYPLNDTSAAVRCIKKLLREKELWVRMRQKAHKRILDTFSVQQMALITAEQYFLAH